MQIQSTTNLRNYNNYYTLPYNVSKMSKVHSSVNMSFRGADELVEAAAEGDLDRVKQEVKKGTSIKKWHEYYYHDNEFSCRSAQTKAAENGHANVISYLFSFPELDPNAVDGASHLGLCDAIKNKHYNIANMYLKHEKINEESLNEALYVAYNNDEFEMFCKILGHEKSNPNINVGDYYAPRTALSCAFEKHQENYINILLNDPRVEIDLKDPFIAPFLRIANAIDEHRELQIEQKEQKLKEQETDLKTREEEFLQKVEAFNNEKNSFDETIKTKTVEIRKEETEKANKVIEKQKADLAKQQEELEQEKQTLDNMIKNYQTLIAEDVINARDALAVGYRALYGADSEEIPKTMDFDEQTIYVLNVLGKRQDKLTATSSETPNKITKAIQDDTGNISLDGLKFLERAIDACKEKFSEKDLLDSIKCVKGSYGLFDMKKTALFISNISWKDNSIRSVIQKVEKYGSKIV